MSQLPGVQLPLCKFEGNKLDWKFNAGAARSLHFLRAYAAAFEPVQACATRASWNYIFPAATDEGHLEGLRRSHDALQFSRVPRPDDVMHAPDVH